ncbi:IS1595 family transposase [Paenibacillus polymyxa]|uniref:IS1595 family transposase n=1 Tax=Paenibacillus polymyxa TaxID=1406 RepID=UPI00046EE566|nr:IS1595 family transposase [Paenibacillus polymyxa]
MDLKELKKLANADSEKRELVYFLQTRTTGIANQIRAIDEIQEQKHKDGLVCPHCKNHSVVRFGKYAVKTRTGEVKRQRYRCKSCRQTFNDLTNTPLQRTRRPHIWVRYIECMIEGFSLRKCAEQLNDEVTHVTLFYWRHKILSALKQIPTDAFQDIVEMDETYFLFSEKGRRNITERKPRKRGGKANYRGISHDQVCVLVARDRQKMTYSGVLGRGRIRTTKLDEAIGGHLLVWFRYLDSKEYENTASNKKNTLVKSCLFTVTDTNTKLRISAYSC